LGREVELEKLLNSVINLISRYMDLNSSSLIKEVNDFLSLRGSRVRLEHNLRRIRLYSGGSGFSGEA